jgi:hypothetical protein
LDTFAWPAGSALEEFGVNVILTWAPHFNKQLSTTEVKDKCKEALSNERCEFGVLGLGKKLNEFLDLALANDKIFAVLGKLLSVLRVEVQLNESCEKQLEIVAATTNLK